jgi:hypothetical protein
LQPKELLDIFNKYGEDDFSLVIIKADFATEPIIVEVAISVQAFNDNETINRKWTIQIHGHRKSKLSFDLASSFDIKEDHPLLWEFNDTLCDLYFNGQCTDPAKLFVDLYKINASLFGNYIPVETFFNKTGDIYKLLNASSGLLAKGSRKLLTIYGSCLEQYNLKHSIIGERQPSYWDGQQFVPERGNAKVLFIGDSYIIADKFVFM